MEQPSKSVETLNGDTKKFAASPRRLALVATTEAEEDDALAGGGQSTNSQTITVAPAADAPSGAFSPPYWKTHDRTNSTVSEASFTHTRPARIQLEDRSDEDHEVGRACWAKHVTVDDHVVVGGGTLAGAYVVWNCSVETLKGAPFTIRKRYSEFDSLRENLVRSFPHSAASIPELPRKSVISRFRPKFLEQRRAGLYHFLNCVLLNPEFSGSPLVKDFVFS